MNFGANSIFNLWVGANLLKGVCNDTQKNPIVNNALKVHKHEIILNFFFLT
jgi:hypothetical protein